MGLVAQVIINITVSSIQKAFSYAVPDALAHVDVGWRVIVPFGSRLLEGFVIEMTEEDTAKLKSLVDALDDGPWFDKHMMQTAKWIQEYYVCSAGEALRLFIPGKSGLKSTVGYCLRENTDRMAKDHFSEKADIYWLVYDYLFQNGTVSEKVLTKKFGNETKMAVRYLLRNKLIRTATINRSAADYRYQTVVSLNISRMEAETKVNELSQQKQSQKRLLAALLEKNPLTATELRSHKITMDTVSRLEKANIVHIDKVRMIRDSYADIVMTDRKVELTEEQKTVHTAVYSAISEKRYASFLLHGITGSGKTQVYLEAVAAVRRLGRQAIVLVPEIALTDQIVRRFKNRFGADVVVLHSKLSAGERFDTWQRIRHGEAGIVIGARSAIFAPVLDLGIVVIDEEHEFTYKQEETPRYHAREVAQTRARLSNAAVLLGSATPAIETYYQAQKSIHTLLRLTKRIDGAFLPAVKIVDMREELQRGNRSVMSAALQALLQQTIADGNQAIILLNRRGYSTFVMCRECGRVLHCRHCAISLVYHLTDKSLRCHYCGSGFAVPNVCPHCGSRYIKYFGTGTQKAEEELIRFLPDARVIRMDQDTTGSKMGHEKIIQPFAEGKYNILLGTQMVAKGHDIQNVTAVGIISADTALNLPDFRASEKTFALITQVAGRAGRGRKSGEVVVQTYNPEHFAIKTGAEQDYEAFFAAELTSRAELRYPPFSNLLKMVVQAKNDGQARRNSEAVAQTLRSAAAHFSGVEIIGPVPAIIAQIKDIFRMIIIVKAQDLTEVKQVLSQEGFDRRTDITIDIDPVNMM
ncbi:MAG: primosomal protein N' [Negativicutes bacterium]